MVGGRVWLAGRAGVINSGFHVIVIIIILVYTRLHRSAVTIERNAKYLFSYYVCVIFCQPRIFVVTAIACIFYQLFWVICRILF
jgi:hypothetical protein